MSSNMLNQNKIYKHVSEYVDKLNRVTNIKERLGVFVFSLLASGGQILAQDSGDISDDNQQTLEEVVLKSQTMLGGEFQARNRSGSAYYVSPKEMARFGYTDINRVLKAVPGVNVQEEDGYGLRPNISLRGTLGGRSQRIALMEDGVLVAPAPYGEPAAYYFPNAARMHAVEVLKGSSQVQYGPFTTAGAINLISTPIPDKLSVRASATYGTNQTIKGYGFVGDMKKHFGYSLEYLRFQSRGFKRFADGTAPNFGRNDVVAKIMFKTDRQSGGNHLFQFKFGYADELSKETYLGLSREDYNVNPFLRYEGSRLDQFVTSHYQYVLTHVYRLSSRFHVTTDAYVNQFARNWYRLNAIRTGVNAAGKPIHISNQRLLADPQTNSRAFNMVKGNPVDHTDAYQRSTEALILRANNRSYHSRGIQTRAWYRFFAGEWKMESEFGLRLHQDISDRFQWEDEFAMNQGKLVLLRPGIRGSQSNRITSAVGLSTHVLQKMTLQNLLLTAGFRFESVRLAQDDFGKRDSERTGRVRVHESNVALVPIPSLAVHYQVSREISVFSGVHRGFSPPGAGTGQKPESSLNVELGSRFSSKGLHAEVIGFYNGFSNMIGSDLNAVGGFGTLRSFDVGKAAVGGMEVLMQYRLDIPQWGLQLPIRYAYTYTRTSMQRAFRSPAWGHVVAGDEIPYIYRHSMNLQLSADHEWFGLNVGVRYNGDMRATPGQGPIAQGDKIPAHLIVDASARVKITRNLSVVVNAINVTNRVYLVSLHPSGLRPGHPLGIFAGVNMNW